MCRDFNCIDGFKYFDKNHAGSITISEVLDGLSELGIEADKSIAYLLFRHYDRDNDSRIRYSDFLDMITPSEQSYSDLVRGRSTTSTGLSASTIDKLRDLFQVHLNLEEEAEKIRQKANFDHHNAF